MYLIPTSREQLLYLLPKGGRIAEVGVARGQFSRAILDVVAPAHLDLIDLWAHQEEEDYQPDPCNWSDEQGDAIYRQICADFAAETASGQVTIHRELSTRAAAQIPDASLDWVYIDAMHTYEAVAADLAAFAPKIKPGGLILGHDYAKHPAARAMGFGVVEAVDEFVHRRNHTFLVLTADPFPTFVLAEDPGSAAARTVTSRLFQAIPGTVEIADFPDRPWEHRLAPGPDNQNYRAYMVF